MDAKGATTAKGETAISRFCAKNPNTELHTVKATTTAPTPTPNNSQMSVWAMFSGPG